MGGCGVELKWLNRIHTLRKTFDYRAYKAEMNIALIQKLLNHHSPATTLAYIGITQDSMDNVYLSVNLERLALYSA